MTAMFVNFVCDTDAFAMGELMDSISALDGLVGSLLEQVKELKARNGKLEEEVQSLRLECSAERQKLVESEAHLSALRLANGLMGGENKAETRLKINTLIRDIDHCIAQLSE